MFFDFIFKVRFPSTQFALYFMYLIVDCLLIQASNNQGDVCEVRSAIWTFVLPKYQLMCQLVSTCKSVTTFSIVSASKHDNYPILGSTP